MLRYLIFHAHVLRNLGSRKKEGEREEGNLVLYLFITNQFYIN